MNLKENESRPCSILCVFLPAHFMHTCMYSGPRFARPGFGAVAVVTFVFQRIPAYTFAGFFAFAAFAFACFCICWLLRSKSGPAIPRIGVLLAMLAAMRTRSSRTERLMAGLLKLHTFFRSSRRRLDESELQRPAILADVPQLHPGSQRQSWPATARSTQPQSTRPE